MNVVVVGAKGTLGARLTDDLGATGVDFRAADGHGAWTDAVRAADAVVNAGGPRVRPGLVASDYDREHVGVVEAVVQSMRPDGHLVHLSSTAVFGARGATLSAQASEAPERFPMPEYAAAKLRAERAARAGAARRGLRLTVLRPSMVYGPAIDSAVESVRRLARRGVSLSLRPRSLRQHLLHVDLLLAAVRAALRAGGAPAGVTESSGGPRGPAAAPLLVADPFVLTNADLLPAGRMRCPVVLPPLALLQRASRALPRRSLALDSLAVLAMDNVFEVAETFERLGLERESFDRTRTFDRYFAS